jgi:uncharacterized membrane protein YhaH (DUF805 family)
MLMFQPLRKYADFKGRARRAEYWSFMLLQSLAYGLIVGFALTGLGAKDLGSGIATVLMAFGILGLVSLALFLPNLAVLARRMHDINLSAWCLLLLVPSVLANMKTMSTLMTLGKTQNMSAEVLASQLAGTSMISIVAMLCSLAVFVITVWPGTSGNNKFGPDPKGGSTVDIRVFDDDRIDAVIAEAKAEKRERDPDYKPVFDFTSPSPAAGAPPSAPPSPAAMAQSRQTPTFGKRR